MVKKLTLFLLFFLSMSLAVSASSLKLESMSTNPSTITTGDEVELVLKVQHISTDKQYAYELELVLEDDLSQEYLTLIDSKEYLGTLGQNEFWNAKFKLLVENGAPSTEFPITVLIKKISDGSVISQTQAEISLDVSGDTFFVLDSQEKTIRPGELKTFDVSLANVGGTQAGDIKVTFENSPELQLVGTNSFYFSSIGANLKEQFDVSLYADSNLNSGTYTIPVTIEYSDGISTLTQTIDVGVVVGGDIDLNIVSIETTPKEVRPGTNFVKLSVEFENSGESDLKLLETQIISEEFTPSYANGNKVFVGRLDASESKVVDFYVDISKEVPAQMYDLSFDTSYSNLVGEEFETSLSAPFYVKDTPLLEVEFQEQSFAAGDEVELEFDVVNFGLEKAQEIEARLIVDSSLPISVKERSVYVGTLDANESSRVAFTLDILRDARFQDYDVRVALRARGDSEIGDTSIYTFEDNVKFSIDSKSPNYLAIFGALVVVIVVISLVMRKRKTSSSKK